MNFPAKADPGRLGPWARDGSRAPLARPLGLLLLTALVGCAPALPSFSGSRTTPSGRTDLAVGMAARVPTGDLAAGTVLALAAPAGIAPAGVVRVGVSDDVDVGLVVAGAGGRAELRFGGRVGQLRAHLGMAAHAGYATTPLDVDGAQGQGWRAGAFVPLTLAFDVAGILEAWLGARFALDRVEGVLADSAMNAPSSAWGVRGGGVVGIALGFRRVHVLAELAVDGEWWSVASAGASLERAGVALTPALAVRLRL